MKLFFISLIMSAVTLPSLADSKPTMKNIELGTYHGKDMFRSCSLTIEENHRGQIVATFTRGKLWFKSFAVPLEIPVMTSTGGQTWQDFTISGITHAGITFRSAYDLTPETFHVSEGRGTKIINCKGLKK